MNDNNYIVVTNDMDEFYMCKTIDEVKKRISSILNEDYKLSEIDVYAIRKLDVSANIIITDPLT